MKSAKIRILVKIMSEKEKSGRQGRIFTVQRGVPQLLLQQPLFVVLLINTSRLFLYVI